MKIIPFAAAIMLWSGSLHAATVSYSGSTGNVSGFGTFSLQQFDGTLGTLTGIAVEMVSSFTARFVAAQETLSDSGTVSGDNGFVISTIVNIKPVSILVPNLVSTGGTAFSAAVPPTYQQLVSGGVSDTQNYGALAPFIGLGVIDYEFVGFASDTSSADSGVLRGVQGYSYFVDANITYTYDTGTGQPPVVPLPASLPLLLAGLGGLGLMRRKSK